MPDPTDIESHNIFQQLEIIPAQIAGGALTTAVGGVAIEAALRAPDVRTAALDVGLGALNLAATGLIINHARAHVKLEDRPQRVLEGRGFNHDLMEGTVLTYRSRQAARVACHRAGTQTGNDYYTQYEELLATTDMPQMFRFLPYPDPRR